MIKKFDIQKPKPYQKIGTKFTVKGWISKEWLNENFNFRSNLSIEFIDLDCRVFIGASIEIKKYSWLSRFTKKIYFSQDFKFSNFDLSSLKKSYGRIAIKIESGDEAIFIPLKVKGFESKIQDEQNIIIKQKTIPERTKKYEKEWGEYFEEFGKIIDRLQKKSGIDEYSELNYNYVDNDDLKKGILDILEKNEENLEEINQFAQEDLELYQLHIKYKDAIEFMGSSMLGHDVLTYKGFHMIFYSNDHGKHFHVIHKGKGIDARFSFPEIQLESYKNEIKILNKKQIKDITNFLKIPDNFKKLEVELHRREGP